MTVNLQADAMTRATQIALRELKQKLRDEGKRQHEIFTTDLGKAIGDHIRSNPRILERAATEVAAWRGAKLKTNAQKSKR